MTLVKGNKEDKELSERQRKTKDLLDKMHDSVNEEKFAYLANEVAELSFDVIELGKSIVKDIKKRQLNSTLGISEEDEYRLARVNRIVESCAKSLDSVSNFKNKRFTETTDAIRTEVAIENSKKEVTNTNIIFQWQGDGKKSLSPVMELLGEVIPNPPKEEVKALPPAKPKENPLEIDGKSYSKSSNAKQQRNKNKLCYILRVILDYPLKPYQVEWLRLPQYRINEDGKKVATTSCLTKSRRIGGTYATSLKIIMGACGFNPSDGTDCTPMDYYFASATHRQAKEVIEECADIASQLRKHDARFEYKASKLSIEFIHPKTSIVAIPASPRSIRGSTGGLVLDEICFMQDFPSIWKAAKALAFSNIKKPEGYPVFLISTPWAVGTLQHEIMMGIGDSYKKFIRMQVSYEKALADGFPGPSPQEVRQEFGDDAYMVEFMLEWLAVGVTYFPLPLLEKSKVDIIPDDMITDKQVGKRTILESELKEAPRYFGIDIGATHDLTVITELADLGDIMVCVNQSILRGVPLHEQSRMLINYIESSSGHIAKIRVDRGTVGKQCFGEINEYFGSDIVEPFDGNLKRQLSHCKNLKSMFERGILRVSSQFTDRFTGRKNSSTTTFVELNKIGLELTVAGNVTVKTPRDLTGHCDRAWSLLIAVGRGNTFQGAEIFPENAVIQGHSIYGDGSLIYPPERDGFMESLGIYGFSPIPERKVLVYELNGFES